MIRENLPKKINRYIEPFVGGGAVFFGLKPEKALINDLSEELIELYECVRDGDPLFFDTIHSLYENFRKIDALIDESGEELLSLYGDLGKSRSGAASGKTRSAASVDTDTDDRVRAFLKKHGKQIREIGAVSPTVFRKEAERAMADKLRRAAKLEKKKKMPEKDRIASLEAALKGAYYTVVRSLYNAKKSEKGYRTACFYFVREYCYSSMFRYNAKGAFNVPYGGISYNRKKFEKKIAQLESGEMQNLLENTEIRNLDFEAFLKEVKPKKGDFIFLDPPYDSEFSTYCQNPFDKEAQRRLCECLKKTKASVMLVIRDTPYIRSLYKKDFKIREYDKNYLVSFKNRNKRNVNHLMITNY